MVRRAMAATMLTLCRRAIPTLNDAEWTTVISSKRSSRRRSQPAPVVVADEAAPSPKTARKAASKRPPNGFTHNLSSVEEYPPLKSLSNSSLPSEKAVGKTAANSEEAFPGSPEPQTRRKPASVKTVFSHVVFAVV
jgi:hypothetical protein